jgi:hypothetical protein
MKHVTENARGYSLISGAVLGILGINYTASSLVRKHFTESNRFDLASRS